MGVGNLSHIGGSSIPFLTLAVSIKNNKKIMKKFETISQELWDAKAKEALDKQPLRKEISLRQLELAHNDTLMVQGKPVRLTQQGFKDLCKIVGLPAGFDKTFTGTFGEGARQQLVNKLKMAAAAKGNTSVSLVFSPFTKEIVGVQKDPREIISNKTFLETTTRIIDRYGLEVNSFSVNVDGRLAINTSSPKNEFSLKGLPNEDHYGGVSFLNSPDGGFEVSPFLYRLVCANGMIGRSFEEAMKITQMDPISMETFWSQMNELARNNFKPFAYEHKIRKAMNTSASLAEMADAHYSILSLSDARLREAETWVPYHATTDTYHRANIDTIGFTNGQKKCAKTGMSVWELVNGITHFATHDNGFKMDDYDRRRLQVEASKLLNKSTYDMENIVPSPF
jgi:hypothetical protein